MHLNHAPAVGAAFPDLVAGALHVDGITNEAAVATPIATHYAIAKERLILGQEAEFPEVKAW
jgi:hypothetical protein